MPESARRSAAVQFVAQLPVASVVLPAQTLGELTRVLSGKVGRSPTAAREVVLGWADSFEVADSSWTVFQAALDLVVDHQLSVWDALVLAVAAENRCRLLLSEDSQNGLTWRGVTVVEPFAAKRSPLLTGLLAIR